MNVNTTGTITGKVLYDVWYAKPEENKAKLNVTNGTFKGDWKIEDDLADDAKNNFAVTGGTFKSSDDSKLDVSDYIPAGSVLTQDEETGKVKIDETKKAVAETGGVKYTSLQAAITNAAEDAEVKLLTDTTEDITVAKGKKITLNLNGQKLTNQSGDTITVELGAELTVTGEGTVDNIAHKKGALFNNGTVTLDGGTFDRSKEAGSDENNPGNNSWYTICNHGKMIINEGVTVTTGSDNVTTVGKFSSLVENGYQDYDSNNQRTGYIANTNQAHPSLTINGGVFNGGLNTVKNDDGGKITIAGGEFKNTTQAAVLNWNEAKISGGTFEVKSDGCSVVLNGRDDTNKSDEEGLNKGELTISGGTFIASKVAAPIGMMNGNADMSAVKVSGGNYSSSVEKEYLDNLNAELYSTAKEPNAPYSYYASVDAAKAADPNGVVKDLSNTTTTEHKLTLDYGYDGKKDEFTGVKFTLPAKPVRSGYTFQGWYNGETKVEGVLELTKDTTVTAKWSRNSSSSGTTTYAITVGSPANGTVTASPKSAAKGATVTLTVAPTEGYQLDKLTVADKDGKEITLTDKGNGKYTFTMPASKVEVTATFKQAPVTHVCPAEKYTDVDTTQWYHEGVDYVIANGMMNGTGTNIFEPNATTTRGMIVTILYRLEKEPAAGTSPFTDVDADQWYAKAVAWAAANGVVNGTSPTTFNPNDPITREQMAAILYRYASFKGYDVAQKADLAGFTDAAQISAYAKDAMSWANKAGLIGGVSATTLQPQGSATRAQVATILMRFCENVAK
ncbi:MAG: S-layer homology domain-containing protein [Clostridiales bacterium]|nr:S-layer homology domain-containing protein [Clostridiales bacterium]MDY4172342.1 S-layer homology domain-containing protein [Evtepia sp.]